MEEVEESKLRKMIILVIGIFLLILFIVYLTTNPIIRDILAGLIESNKIKGHIVEVDAKSNVIFEEDIFNELNKTYYDNLNREFKVCLKGKIINNNYFINEIVYPKMFFQSYKEVSAEACPDDSLISLHSHPYKHCLPSQQDLYNFEGLKEKNNNALLAVMCTENRFNFYR